MMEPSIASVPLFEKKARSRPESWQRPDQANRSASKLDVRVDTHRDCLAAIHDGGRLVISVPAFDGFMGTLLSICLVFVYWNTLLLARILGSPGPDAAPPLLPPTVAAWSQNVLFVLLGLIVLRQSE